MKLSERFKIYQEAQQLNIDCLNKMVSDRLVKTNKKYSYMFYKRIRKKNKKIINGCDEVL